MLEAMATGMPVVSYPTLGISDFFVHERDILLADNPKDIRKYLEYFAESTIIKDTDMRLLKSLKELGYNIAVTTNGIREVQLQRISIVGLDAVVDKVITSEDVGKAKPSPVMFQTALDNFSITRNEAFVIGDSLSSDIKGANNAGIRSCWLSYGKHLKTNKNGPKPDIVANDFSIISSFILQLENL